MTSNLKLCAVFLLGAVVASIPNMPFAKPALAADTGAIEKYKLVPLMQLEGREEEELNKLAADGWKVRTAAGAAVIMAK